MECGALAPLSPRALARLFDPDFSLRASLLFSGLCRAKALGESGAKAPHSISDRRLLWKASNEVFRGFWPVGMLKLKAGLQQASGGDSAAF